MSTTARSRPCDTCRVRKTRCVKADDQSGCVLCAFHGKSCTFFRGPPARRPKAARRAVTTTASRDDTTTSQVSARGASLSLAAGNASQQQQQQQQSLDDDAASSPDMTLPPPPPEDLPNDDPALSLLAGTLGLDLDTHPEYIGQSSYHEPALLDLCHQELNETNLASGRRTSLGVSPRHDQAATEGGGLGGSKRLLTKNLKRTRRMDEGTMFLICPDDETASEPQRIADCDAIEESVGPLGKSLTDLYFRIVHPSFPVLHKGVFLTKHSISHRLFSPPLLAAVYLIALDHWLYDPAAEGIGSGTTSSSTSGSAQRHGQPTLEALALRTMTDDLRRPKLSTLQAGLLLLQRHNNNNNNNNSAAAALQPLKCISIAQLVAAAQELGLHLDCTSWSIPEWEKGLRRRLGWALYTQDRWGALTHGRPLLLHDDDWDLCPCAASDFPETQADEDPDVDGSVGVEIGREIFMRQAQLAIILSDVITNFYTIAATKPGGKLDQLGVINAVNLARPLILRLREWHASLPADLSVDNIQHRRLSANASLHLSFASISIALDRALLRLLTPSSPPSLTHAVRSTAKSRVTSTIDLLKSLQPEHMGALWGGASAHQVVSVGSLAGLLWATTEDEEEVRWCAERIDELRWCLRVRGQGAAFMREALRLLDSDLGRLDLIASRGWNKSKKEVLT